MAKASRKKRTRAQPIKESGEPPIRFVIARKKKLADLTPDDVPPGMTPEMVASDWPPWRWNGR